MNQTWMLILSAAIAYLLGSISFSYLISKSFKHEDIRSKGSGNAGTANMLRNYGWKLGLATLAGDLLKGVLAALIGLWLAGRPGMFLGAVFAVIGHNYPVFLKFRGGKGIATGLGALLVVQPLASMIIFAVGVVLVLITRIMSVGSLFGLIASAVVGCFISGGDWMWNVTVIIIAVLGLWAHRGNIERLLRGDERHLNLRK